MFVCGARGREKASSIGSGEVPLVTNPSEAIAAAAYKSCAGTTMFNTGR